jgi:hypothetical protein
MATIAEAMAKSNRAAVDALCERLAAEFDAAGDPVERRRVVVPLLTAIRTRERLDLDAAREERISRRYVALTALAEAALRDRTEVAPAPPADWLEALKSGELEAEDDE